MSNLELGRGIHFGMSGQQCQIVPRAQERVGLANSVTNTVEGGKPSGLKSKWKMR